MGPRGSKSDSNQEALGKLKPLEDRMTQWQEPQPFCVPIGSRRPWTVVIWSDAGGTPEHSCG
jgi:hypothetical protein